MTNSLIMLQSILGMSGDIPRIFGVLLMIGGALGYLIEVLTYFFPTMDG